MVTVVFGLVFCSASNLRPAHLAAVSFQPSDSVVGLAQMLNLIAESRARHAASSSGDARQVRPRVDPASTAAVRNESAVGVLLRRAAGITQVTVGVPQLERALQQDGALQPSDFLGISPYEAQEIWTPFRDVPLSFVEAFVGLCKNVTPDSVGNDVPLSAVPPPRNVQPQAQAVAPLVRADAPAPLRREAAAARAALRLCAAARASGQVPLPDVLADAILALAKADVDLFTMPPRPPRQELVHSHSGGGLEAMAEQATWLEFCGWRASARGYSSAVRLYGRVAALSAARAWPPTPSVLDIYVGIFRSAATLSRYLSHLRTVLLWLRCPLGPLADTARVVRGAEKAGRALRRPRVRATAAQTKALAKWCTTFGFEDVGASWVVARHFCLRYGEVLQIGLAAAPVSISIGSGGRKEAVITYMRRKCYAEPVQVARRCVCQLQGKALCGVCVLVSRHSQHEGALFPGVTYSESLATLKVAAQACGIADAASWGTHAFRRGWATECLQANGPTALFYSGGWRGLTAFAYASARARGDLAAAEFLVDHAE